MNMEHKDLTFSVKALDQAGTFEGAAAVANTIDFGGDIIDLEAFKACVNRRQKEGRMPKMLWQHDPRKIIGVWDEMEIRGDALYMKGRLLLDIPLAKEAYVLLSAKALDGISIGYKTYDYQMEGENRVRRLMDIDVLEASLVTFPMNPKARVSGVKHLADIRDVESILRDAGVPNRFAKLVASYGYDAAKQMLETGERDAPYLEPRQVNDLHQALTNLKEALNG